MGRFFSEANVTLWTEVSASMFLVFFVFIVFTTYSPKRKAQLSKNERLPIED